MAEDSSANTVVVQFMGGESLTLAVADGACVKDLILSVKAAKPPPRPHARLQLALNDGRILTALESVSSLVGATMNAIYRASETAYLVKESAGSLVLLDEGDEAWIEKLGNTSFVAEDKWVPAPDIDGVVIENFAKESLGVTVTASSNIFRDSEKLNNVIRLGSKFGEPRYMPGGDNSFIFSGSDMDPMITMDLATVAVVVRVGSMCYGDRWLDFFKVESSADGDTWVPWGEDRTRRRAGGVVFFDRAPTKVRFLRFRATSGHVSGARIGPLFVYGIVEPVPDESKEASTSATVVEGEREA